MADAEEVMVMFAVAASVESLVEESSREPEPDEIYLILVENYKEKDPEMLNKLSTDYEGRSGELEKYMEEHFADIATKLQAANAQARAHMESTLHCRGGGKIRSDRGSGEQQLQGQVLRMQAKGTHQGLSLHSVNIVTNKSTRRRLSWRGPGAGRASYCSTGPRRRTSRGYSRTIST
jgi:hypothetical protein